MATGQSSYSSTGGTTYYDLTTATGDRAEINDALFFQSKPDDSSGTGLIQAIVRVQDPGSGDGFENGYNSSARPVAYEENTSPNFTTSLVLNSVPIVTIDGVQYYEFRLDINQLSGTQSKLSLDEIKLYSSDVSDGQATGTIGGTWFTDHATLVYDMDGSGNSSVLLDSTNSTGSGSSDMFFYVPVSNFNGADPDVTYVTLYSEFGSAGTLDATDGLAALDDSASPVGDSGVSTPSSIYGSYTANDGFEEWSVSKQTGGVISGYKWDDSNGNGVWDSGETGLAGWTIDYSISYVSGHGKHSQTVNLTGSVVTSDGTTDVDGDGTIDPAGFYAIFVPASTDKSETYHITLTEEGQAGFVNTYDGDGTANSTTTFTFSGDNLTLDGSPLISGAFGATHAMNFGNFETFTISGTKYEDVNGNGVVDSGDNGLSGWTIFIDADNNGQIAGDTNNDGVLDAGETWTEKYAFTDSNGDWSISGLDASYNNLPVKEILQDGWVQTLGPVSTIVGTSGNDQDDFDFANFETFTISGTKYEDVNGNGVVDSGDNGLAGWVVFIDADNNDQIAGDTNNNGVLDGTETWTEKYAITDSSGNWSISGLDASYDNLPVKEFIQDGWVQTLSPSGTIDATSGNDQDNLDFANFETFTISGTKYNDVNGNGVVDSGDNGLANWVVFIDADNNDQIAGDTNNNGVLDGTETWTEKYAITDSSGNWSISGLDASYDNLPVKEFIKDGWIQTLAPAGNIVGTSGNDQTGMDFANFLPNPDISITKYVKTDVSGVYEDANDPNGPLASTNTTVDFKVVVSNTGNEALSGISISDTVDHNGVETNDPIDYNLVGAHIDIDNDGIIDGLWSDYDENMDGTLDDADGNFLTDDDFVLGVGDSFAVYYSLDSALGQHENTAAVEAVSAISDTTVSAEDDANYYVLADEDCVGVRTPGFWANSKWGQFWNYDPTKASTLTDQDSLQQAGQPNFPGGELLYKIDVDKNGTVDNVSGLLIGDYNKNGITDAGEDTLYISLDAAKKLINASNKQLVDGKTADGIWMLGRDMVATWLNYLANNPGSDTGNCVGGVDSGDGTNSPREFLDAAIDWMQQFASDANSTTASNNLINSYHDGDHQATFQFDARVAPSSVSWQNAFTPGEDIPVSAAAMHSALDAYNNTGKIAGIEYCCDADSQVVLNVLTQVHENLF